MTKQEKCICIQLRGAARTLTSYYNAMLGPVGITINQYSLLHHLQELGTANMSALAEELRLDRSTLARNIKPLIAAELVCDSAIPGTRNKQLQLTEIGEQRLLHAKKLWKKAQLCIEDQLGEKRLKSLIKALAKIETIGGHTDDL
ncbi:MAG: MarR family winged helix-turn-helix transcriptional regulator [Christensenella sp.]